MDLPKSCCIDFSGDRKRELLCEMSGNQLKPAASREIHWRCYPFQDELQSDFKTIHPTGEAHSPLGKPCDPISRKETKWKRAQKK